ncbi:unnamed protein product, partial [Mesorhabditis spiculigera]
MDKPEVLPELKNFMDLGLDGADDVPVIGRSKQFDFFKSLPTFVKHLLVSHISHDIYAFIDFARTSRTNWELVCTSPRRFFEVEFFGSDVCMLYHCGSKRYLFNKPFWGPLLNGAKVTTLYPGSPGNCEFPGLRVDALALRSPQLWTASQLESYKPQGVKFKEIFLSVSETPVEEVSEDVINFVRDHAEQIAYRIPQDEHISMLYRRFKNSRVRFHSVNVKSFHNYHIRLIDEWLAYKRDLVSITSCVPISPLGCHFDYAYADIWKNTFAGYDVQFIDNRLAVITRSDGKTMTPVYQYQRRGSNLDS